MTDSYSERLRIDYFDIVRWI